MEEREEEDPPRREEKGLLAIHWEERELSFAEAMGDENKMYDVVVCF